MLCSLYLGPTPGAWREAVRSHAHWLGLDLSAQTRRLESGVTLEVAWLHPQRADARPQWRDTAEWIVISAFGTVPPDVLAARDGRVLERAALVRDDNLATIAIARSGSELVAVVPPASPHGLLFADAAGGFVLADDLRLFRRLTPARLDDRGLYALAQYGAIPAPLTLFREVRRVPTGHALRLDMRAGVPELVALDAGVPPPRTVGAAEATGVLEEQLQAVLRAIPDPATLYFSGGVDSGLLAAQLARVGRRDVQLVNYCFAPDDDESRLAQRMAARLGFRLHVLPHDQRLVGEVIDRVGRDYAAPFGDISVVPTNILVRRAAAVTPKSGTTLEGTGADGLFAFGAMYPWWKRVYALPRIVRRALGVAYRTSQMWRLNNRLTQGLRFARKSVQMSLAQAVVAQHALEGIGIHSTASLRDAVAETARTFVERRNSAADPAAQLSAVELTWACVGRMTAKSFDPLRQTGVAPRYPYLEPRMLAVSATLSWAANNAGGESKAPLKTLLARDVPPDWVYRRKHGFTPREREIFSSAAVQERLDSLVLATSGPFAGLCRTDWLRSMIGPAARGAVGSGVYDLLWVLLFTALWLDQVPAGRTPESSDAPFPALQTVGL